MRTSVEPDDENSEFHRGVEPFGALPNEAISLWEYGGIRAELSYSIFVDPDSVSQLFPASFKPVLLRERAQRDAELSAILATKPEYGDHLLTVLAFLWLDELRLNGVSVRAERPQKLMVWSAALSNQFEGMPDVRAIGSQRVDLGIWYDDADAFRAAAAFGLPRFHASIEIVNTHADRWDVWVDLPDGQITARCDLEGDRTASNYPLPAYSTWWCAGSSPRLFTLYTYFGHRNRTCRATLTANGSHMLARAIRSAPIELVDATDHIGWRARAAMYTILD